jgi:hypothetical protein
MTTRARTCKARGCRVRFTPRNSLQQACSLDCAMSVSRERAAKAEKRAAMQRRRQQADDRERVKTRRQLMSEATAAVHRLVRELDEGWPCITCDRLVVDDDLITGSRWHAGHYRSRGSAPELRFDARNIHRQCAACNRPGGHTAAEYRDGLLRRYGIAMVEWLDGPHPVLRLSADDLRRVRDEARSTAKWHRQLRREGQAVDAIAYRLCLMETHDASA